MAKSTLKLLGSLLVCSLLLMVTAPAAQADQISDLQSKMGSTDFSGLQSKLNSMTSTTTATAPAAASTAPSSQSSLMSQAESEMNQMTQGYQSGSTNQNAQELLGGNSTGDANQNSILSQIQQMGQSGVQSCTGQVLNGVLKNSNTECNGSQCTAYQQSLKSQVNSMLNPQNDNLLGSTTDSVFTLADFNSMTKSQQKSFLKQNPQFQKDMDAYNQALAKAATQAANC